MYLRRLQVVTFILVHAALAQTQQKTSVSVSYFWITPVGLLANNLFKNNA